MKKPILLATTLASFLLLGCGSTDTQGSGYNQIALGEQLFHDTTLSQNKTMSCATCHVIDAAMIDPRETSNTLGASLGDDGFSIADRNAPTAAYAAFSPAFHFNSEEGLFIGGQFLDGKASTLSEQAKGPFLNPVEMNMPDSASVIERVKENSHYVDALKSIYGDDVFDDTDRAYEAVAQTIAKFEKSSTFSPFDSKYDRAQKGQTTLSESEKRGLTLFNGKATCNACHLSEGENALFTDFTYDNLGVPVNHALREANGKGADFVDNGLYGNPAVKDETLKGAFRVSTLRNIGATAPYMHNGVFKDLKTVIHFYNTRDVAGAVNPETGEVWEKGEVDINKNTEELGNLQLSEAEENDLLAFLLTLTDAQYEHLAP
jgi:cytochrome c peroxidase